MAAEAAAASSTFTISPVTTASDLEVTISLIDAYTKSLNIDLAYQDHAAEMANMPGKYSPASGGALLLARKTPSGEPIGCVAMRKLDAEEGSCEMKRLYVDPAGRGLGVGRALALASIAEARRVGYRVMRLDTLEGMGSARGLYGSLGFREIGAYYWSPVKDTRFLELEL